MSRALALRSSDLAVAIIGHAFVFLREMALILIEIAALGVFLSFVAIAAALIAR